MIDGVRDLPAGGAGHRRARSIGEAARSTTGIRLADGAVTSISAARGRAGARHGEHAASIRKTARAAANSRGAADAIPAEVAAEREALQKR